MTDLSFEGRRVIVTGAGRGIGRAYVHLLAARGAHVAVVDAGSTTDGSATGPEDPAADVAAEVGAAGGSAIAVRADVTNEREAHNIVAQTAAAFGGVDAVINNAGIVRTAPFQDISAEEYQRHLNVHFFGSLWLCRAAWPHLRASGSGRVLNTVSAAMLGNPMMTHYGSSKGAVFGLTRNLAIEGAPDKIRVNAIAPAAGTRMADASSDAISPETLEFLHVAMLPELVAPVGAYLVHPDCSVTGEVFNAGGGGVNRMAVVNTAGYYDQDLTVEGVASHFDQIMAVTATAQPQVLPAG
ncbi:MAG: SDR family NAD(P)-dependent oxidoreductase [Actinomycetota bacterium]|nr:SDR family NAD(P)-dependent oxidoreductase [Actinomycetota bacterium]